MKFCCLILGKAQGLAGFHDQGLVGFCDLTLEQAQGLVGFQILGLHLGPSQAQMLFLGPDLRVKSGSGHFSLPFTLQKQ